MLEITGRGGMLRMADTGAGTGGMPATGAENVDASGETAGAQTYDAWYAALDASAKSLVDGHVQGLRTALSAERQQRGELAKNVRDLAKKAEAGSDMEKTLTEVSRRLAQAERRAEFFEGAARPEIGCTNVRLAFLLAEAEDAFDKQGRPDWEFLRKSAPELFRRPGVGSVDGGAGATSPARLDMNTMIRRAAGRG